MSSYATIVTEPFWESDLPEVAAYLRERGWTAIRRGPIALATILEESDDDCISARIQAASLCCKLQRHLPEGRDFSLTLAFEMGHPPPQTFSVQAEWAKTAAFTKAREARVRTLAASAARDEAQAGPSPGLDEFLRPLEG